MRRIRINKDLYIRKMMTLKKKKKFRKNARYLFEQRWCMLKSEIKEPIINH